MTTPLNNLLLLSNLAATLYLTGLIWVIQVVHYPLFANVGAAEFVRYEALHNVYITAVVLLPMLIEIATAALLALPALDSSNNLTPLERTLWLVGLALVGVVWASTFFLQVPQHSVLASGFNARAHAFLVSSNWLRTLAWTARSALLLYLLWGRLK